ncbi:MAG: sugar transferase [Armatimonadetes bacterium]|nr:sugar transferase [Armatimonadota bacterium]
MESINGWAKPGEIVYSDTARTRSLYEIEKRLLDVVLSLSLLIVLAPLIAVVAIAVKLDSAGPVLYRRRVVGRGKKAFHAFKLRTMVDGAESIESDDPKTKKEMEANHKLRHDRRVTRIGMFLRKTSIDELPQLLNVLFGQMSLVGPRMISFPEIEKFGMWQGKILSVKPGITGLWQVSGRSKLSYEDRVRLNVYYVDHRSAGMDLFILLKTIPAVLTGNGAY